MKKKQEQKEQHGRHEQQEKHNDAEIARTVAKLKRAIDALIRSAGKCGCYCDGMCSLMVDPPSCGGDIIECDYINDD